MTMRIDVISAVLVVSLLVVSAVSPLPLNTSDVSAVWSTTWDGIRVGGVKSVVTATAVDPNDGTIVTVGFASGAFVSHTNVGGFDGFVIKTAPANGANIWARFFATPQDDFVMGVCIDASGAIYISGHSSGFLQGLTNAGSSDHFIVKMTADGDQTWIRMFGTTSAEYSGGCAVDVFGNLYVVGFGIGQVVFNAPANNYEAIYLLRIQQSNGAGVWNHTMSGGSYNQYLYATTFTDVFFLDNWPAGRGVAVINPIANVTTNVTVVVSFCTTGLQSYIDAPIVGFPNTNEVAVAGYNGLTGAFRWANYYSTSSSDIVTGTTTDSTGATFVVGYTSLNLDGGLYSGGSPASDIFLSKIDLNGNKLWTRLYGSIDYDWGSSVAVDNAGGVYVNAFSQVSNSAPTVLDGFASPYNQLDGSSSYGVLFGVLSKFDSDGSRLWTAIYGAYMPATQTYYNEPSFGPYSTAFDPISGNLYIGGKKTGIWTSDAWPVTASNSDLYTDEAVLIAVQQTPTNCTLQQLDALLAQIDQLLLGF